MKKSIFLISGVTTLLILLASTTSYAQSNRIRVSEVTYGNCRHEARSTTITVEVDNRYRSYNVKCDERFSAFLSLPGGNSCSIDAGMCSGSFPLQEFRVRCSDSRRASIRISCS